MRCRISRHGSWIGRAPNRVTEALLRRELPDSGAGGGPRGGVFTDDLDEMIRWATQLDHSYMAVQGPPGTGKTLPGGPHCPRVGDLRTAGRDHRVQPSGHRESLARRSSRSSRRRATSDDFRACAEPNHLKSQVGTLQECRRQTSQHGTDFNVVAGTTWLFSNEKMRNAPVDVLLIDEAGQLALADALAASTAAHNLILLGDPLQLPHVMQAVHPGGGGRACSNTYSASCDAARGSRSLPHPDPPHASRCVRIHFRGNLRRKTGYHENCARQTTIAGTGLRWLQASIGAMPPLRPRKRSDRGEIAGSSDHAWVNFDGDEKP